MSELDKLIKRTRELVYLVTLILSVWFLFRIVTAIDQVFGPFT